MKWGSVAAAAIAILAVAADPAAAQQVTVDLGSEGAFTGRLFQLIALITVITLAPSLLVVTTSFTRIVVVLSLMRSAIGVQQTPPNTVIVGLALFLISYVMAPTFERAYEDGILPLINDEITEEQAFERTTAPVHKFMRETVREKDLNRYFPDSIRIVANRRRTRPPMEGILLCGHSAAPI